MYNWVFLTWDCKIDKSIYEHLFEIPHNCKQKGVSLYSILISIIKIE